MTVYDEQPTPSDSAMTADAIDDEARRAIAAAMSIGQSETTLWYNAQECARVALVLLTERTKLAAWRTARKAAIANPCADTFAALAEAEHALMRAPSA